MLHRYLNVRIRKIHVEGMRGSERVTREKHKKDITNNIKGLALSLCRLM